MLASKPLGPVGSGGELMTDHVICPNCAHNFPAISEAARDRIAKLEAALREIADFSATEYDDDPLSHVHGTAVKALEQ